MELSNYGSELDNIHRERYLEKIAAVGVDPYLIRMEDCSIDLGHFPNIMYPDIVMYLVNTKSAYTMEEMKAYKSLEAYNQAACGWVKKVAVKEFSSRVVVLGKVMHSQRLREKTLSPWIIASKDGQILSAHCDCVAGLGEVCTHVSAVLFSIDSVLRKTEEVTRTGVKAYWMPPSNRPVDPEKLLHIDLAPPAKKFRFADTPKETPLFRRDIQKMIIPPISVEEKNELLESLMGSQGSVLHLVTKPFADQIKAEVDARKKFCIMNIYQYQEDYETKSLTELQTIGMQIPFSLTTEECTLIEEETRRQSKVKLWFTYRIGRVTASRFKRCCRTKIEKPSISLIKQICYPTTHKYKIKALDYGCAHEQEAIIAFSREMKTKHINFRVEKCGLFVNTKYPWFGASPDGIVSCDCCETHILEIKCPYCVRESTVEDLANKKSFLKCENKNYYLKEYHEYFFQVQMQLALTEKKFCYFVAWSKESLIYTEVEFSPDFWNVQSDLATKFFFKVIVPEALGKYFSRIETSEATSDNEYVYFSDADIDEEVIDNQDDSPKQSASVSTQPGPSVSPQPGPSVSPEPGPSKPIYCICMQEDDKVRPMIACDSEDCQIEWFHLDCVGLSEIPS